MYNTRHSIVPGGKPEHLFREEREVCDWVNSLQTDVDEGKYFDEASD